MNAPSRLPQFHIVGFTGHRQLDQPREIQGAVHTVLEALRHEGPGEWIALSSAAAGADTLFAQQALALGLMWHVVLPLSPAEFRHDFSPAEWKVTEALLPEAPAAPGTVAGETAAPSLLDRFSPSSRKSTTPPAGGRRNTAD